MSLQLVLLLTLFGPFCVFTHASPTGPSTDFSTGATLGTPVSSEEVPGTTAEVFHSTANPPIATNPATPPEEVASVSDLEVTSVASTENPTDVITAVGKALPTDAISTPTPLVQTDPPVTSEVGEAEMSEEVLVEDDAAEGLGSGQVVGIVIGALLAVVVGVAVVIIVVRRMGKYSP